MIEMPLGVDGAVLRQLEPWRAEEFLAHMDRGRDFIGRYIGIADAVTDLESSREFLRSYAERTAADTARIWGIWVDGTLLGGVLFRVMNIGMGTAEAGCWLEPAGVGRGLVTTASRLIIDWAIRERGVYRVEWLVSAGNAASIAVAGRLGMSRDGVLRAAYPHHGRRHDVEVWSVLAPEWTDAGSPQ